MTEHHRNIPMTTEGNLHVYELRHPTDTTKNGEVKCFRDNDPASADRRASMVARREGCTLIRKAVI